MVGIVVCSDEFKELSGEAWKDEEYKSLCIDRTKDNGE